jgi:hypothetical protein
MVKCKATFELRKDNRSTTITQLYRAPGRDELFTQIRRYAIDANRRGFNVDSIKTESVWRNPRLITWPAGLAVEPHLTGILNA